MGRGGRRNNTDDPAHILDPDLPGGNKLYVRPISASVDEAGRVRLSVARADSEAIAVKEGNVEQIHAGRSSGAGARSGVQLPPLFSRERHTANYGTGLPPTRRMAARDQSDRVPERRARVSGYDAEAEKLGGGGGGFGTGQGTVEMIQQLSRGARGEQQ
jgi:hypothetical protein